MFIIDSWNKNKIIIQTIGFVLIFKMPLVVLNIKEEQKK